MFNPIPVAPPDMQYKHEHEVAARRRRDQAPTSDDGSLTSHVLLFWPGGTDDGVEYGLLLAGRRWRHRLISETRGFRSASRLTIVCVWITRKKVLGRADVCPAQQHYLILISECSCPYCGNHPTHRQLGIDRIGCVTSPRPP